MTKTKVLGEMYGITITRPFNSEMYRHNDKVAEIMKKNIIKAIKTRKYNENDLNDMTRSITAYTYGMMSAQEMREEMLAEVDNLQPWWLAQEYGTLVEKGYCKPLKQYMVGFDKK